MEKITRVGIDLGKHVYQVCGMEASGSVVFQRQVRAPGLMELMSRLKPCLVGMEASCGAHHWVEKLSDLGHDVRMMSPQFVRPYVKSNKSDYHDAGAARRWCVCAPSCRTSYEVFCGSTGSCCLRVWR